MANPYQTPEAQDELAFSRPKRVTVFGTLHVIGGILGFILMVSIKETSIGLLRPLLGLDLKEMLETNNLLVAIKLLANVSIYQKCLFLAYALLLVAGISLLRNARWGLRISNIASLGLLIFSLAMTWFYQSKIKPDLDSLCQSAEVSRLIQDCYILQILITFPIAFAAIYALTSFLMLNRPIVKNYRAQL